MKKIAYPSLVLWALAALSPANAQEWAVAKLEASPRHHEWVDVAAGDERTVRGFVAYPEKDGKTLAVVVIHENRGLTDSVRLFADQVAAAGYLAIALRQGDDPEGSPEAKKARDDAWTRIERILASVE